MLDIKREFMEDGKKKCAIDCTMCGEEQIVLMIRKRLESKNHIHCRSCINRTRKLKKEAFSSHPLAKRLHDMQQRCYNINNSRYSSYGGRGILICDEWKGRTEDFIRWGEDNGWEEGLTIDRKDNDKGYSPDNCRFVNASEQQHNKRIYRNNKSGYRGVSYSNRNRKYVAVIMNMGEHKHIGSYEDKREAAIAYNNYIIENELTHTLNVIEQI